MDYNVISVSKPDSSTKIYKITKTNKTTPMKLTIESAYIPFGVEEFNKKYYLNIQLDFDKTNNSKHVGLLYDIEKHFIEYMKKLNDKLIFTSSIKKKTEHFILLKLSIPIIKNNIICNYYADDKKRNILELQKNCFVKTIIKLNTLWIHEDNFGINWILDTIYN